MDWGLISGSGQWDKGQQEGTEAQGVPPEHQEEVPYYAGDTGTLKHKNHSTGTGYSGRLWISPLHGDIQEYLDTLLCHVLWDETA